MLKRILAGLGGTDCTVAAINQAVCLAMAHDADLTGVSVIDPSRVVPTTAMLLDDELSHLLMFPNVLITSHQAFLTHEALSEIARVTTANIIHLDAQEPFLEETML